MYSAPLPGAGWSKRLASWSAWGGAAGPPAQAASIRMGSSDRQRPRFTGRLLALASSLYERRSANVPSPSPSGHRRGDQGHRSATFALPAIIPRGTPTHRPFDDAALAHEGGRKAAHRHPDAATHSRVYRRHAGADVGGIPAPLQDLGLVVELVGAVGDT